MEGFLNQHEDIEKSDIGASVKECSNSSSEDSLGIISYEQLNTSWNEDTKPFELIESFENLKLQNLIEPNFTQKTLNISPILGEEQISDPELFLFESTPKIKHSIQSRYEENILNKTLNIVPLCDDLTIKSNFKDAEYHKPKDVMNITRSVEKEKNNKNFLNRTFDTDNKMNKTLPTIFKADNPHINLTNLEIAKNAKNRTFNKSATDTLNKTLVCQRQEQKKSVQIKHNKPQMKIKNRKSFENCLGLTSPWDTHIDETRDSWEYIPRKILEKDFSQTGAKKKVYKNNERVQTSVKVSSKPDKGKKTYVETKVASNTILKIANRKLQFSKGERSSFNLRFMKLEKEPTSKPELLDIPTIRLVEEPNTDKTISSRLPQRSSLIRRPQGRKGGQSATPPLPGRGRGMPLRMPVASKNSLHSGKAEALAVSVTPLGIPSRSQSAAPLPGGGRGMPLRMPVANKKTLPSGRAEELTVRGTPLRIPDRTHRMDIGRGNFSSRIPTLGPRTNRPHPVFEASNPFQDPPVRGRSSDHLYRKTHKPPFQK